jgi:nicotinamidase-related amidase
MQNYAHTPKRAIFPFLDVNPWKDPAFFVRCLSDRPNAKMILAILLELDRTAFVIVDPQDDMVSSIVEDAGNEDTEAAIAQAYQLRNAFHDAGQKTYIAYLVDAKGPTDINTAKGGLFNLHAEPGRDIGIPKSRDSIFDETDFEEILPENKKVLVVTGVNLSFCVKASINDAIDRGMLVFIVDDGVANGKMLAHHDSLKDIQELKKRGVLFISTGDVLEILSAENFYMLNSQIKSGAKSPASEPTAGSQTPAALLPRL